MSVKSQHLLGLLLMLCGLLLAVVAAAAFVAMVLALTVKTTISAVESAFGSFVVAILLTVLARKAWAAGRERVKAGGGAAGNPGSE